MAAFGRKDLAKKADPDMPEFPWALDYLWTLFLEFSEGLVANGMVPVQAGWNDVQQWCAAMLHDLEPWEKRAVIHLANLRASILAEKKPKSSTAPAVPGGKGRRGG